MGLLSVLILLSMGCRSVDSADYQASLAKLEARRQQARVLNTQAVAAEDPDEQRQLLEEAVRLDELYGEARNNLGVAYYRLGQPYPAATQLQRAADLVPGTPRPYVNLSVLHGSLGQWERALDFAKRASDRDPYDPGVLRSMARALHAMRADRGDLEPVLASLAERDPSPRWREWAVEQTLQLKDRRGLYE